MPISRVLLVAVATTLALALAAPAQADLLRRHFFTFNISGHVRNHGETDVAQAIFNSIMDTSRPQPNAVMLQEVCWRQYDYLRDKLENSTSWRMYGRFLKARDDVDDCEAGDGGRFGNAVFVRGDILETDWVTFDHQDSGIEDRNMVCAKVNWSGRDTRVCSTHLENDDEGCGDGHTCRWWQAREIKNKTQGYIDSGTAVVVGGDFNAKPTGDTLDNMYSQSIFGGGAVGNFKEVDQFNYQPPDACRCGEHTHSSGDKIDYVFLNQQHWDSSSLEGDATDSGIDPDDGDRYSDHRLLHGHAWLRTP